MQAQPLGQEDRLEEGMAAHSSALAWRLPWTEEPGGLRFIGLHTVGHQCSNLHSFTDAPSGRAAREGLRDRAFVPVIQWIYCMF